MKDRNKFSTVNFFYLFSEALNEIAELFKNFKEYELKLNRLKQYFLVTS